MKRKFKIGDKVRLKKDSKFYGQFKGSGFIYAIEEYIDTVVPYNVNADGYTNVYGSEDLELVNIKISDWSKEL